QAVPAGEDEEAAALLEATALDAFAAEVPDFAFLNEERVPRYRLALERAVLARRAATVQPSAAPPVAAASRAGGAERGGAGSSGRSGLAIDRVLAHMAGNRGTGPSSGVVRRKNLRGARRGVDTDDSGDDSGGAGPAAAAASSFVSATAQYARDIRDGKVKGVTEPPPAPRGGGARGRGFVPPARAGEEPASQRQRRHGDKDASAGRAGPVREDSLAALPPEEMPEQLRNLEPRMIEMIENEIMDSGSTTVKFEDIGEIAASDAARTRTSTRVAWMGLPAQPLAGLKHAKRAVVESVIWPMQRPDIFTGLRSLPKGILLFGPPGTGKTLVGKAVAHSCKATFFSISASSLTSKWIGEGEKMVRTLFAVASVMQPSIVFIDEIDSLLQSRSESDNESSRRIKTEFLVQLDGAATKGDDVVVVIGATNRPQELDEAARRRFVKRLYIPLPDADARRHLIKRLLAKNRHVLTEDDIEAVTTATKGYSGADVTNLCKEAALGPVRQGLKGLPLDAIDTVTEASMPPIDTTHFASAMRQVKTSVAQSELAEYKAWNSEFGSYSETEIFGAPSTKAGDGSAEEGGAGEDAGDAAAS
ncbi:fignl1, partial [Symbiodinium sp. KB8]